MECDICDVRSNDSEGSWYKIDYVFEYSTKDICIIIGHGDDQGNAVNGIDFSDFTSKKISNIWLYACNSGKKICSNISKNGINAIGFCTEIIISDVTNPPEIKMLKDYLLTLNKLDFLSLVQMIKQFYKKEALKKFKSGDILDAAILNHTRLALRAFPAS